MRRKFKRGEYVHPYFNRRLRGRVIGAVWDEDQFVYIVEMDRFFTCPMHSDVIARTIYREGVLEKHSDSTPTRKTELDYINAKTR